MVTMILQSIFKCFWQLSGVPDADITQWSNLLQVYPEKVAALPPQQLQTLLHTLEFGIASSEPAAVQSALEALAALAKFDHQSKQSGQPGLQIGPGRAAASGPALLHT